MKKIVHYLAYLVLRGVILVFKVMPFRLLYIISDGLAFIFNKMVGYRREVVYTQLKQSFPEKSEDWIKKVLNKNYRYLSDLIVESLKGFSFSPEEAKKRFKVMNPEILKPYYDAGQSIFIIGGHVGNWEWGTQALPQWIALDGLGIHQKINNPYIEAYFKSLRSKAGFEIIPTKETARRIAKGFDKPTAIVLIADQMPSNRRRAHYGQFMNRDTSFHNGPDQLARRTGFPVFFYDLQQVKRGYYELYLKPLVLKVDKNTPPGTITAAFKTALEDLIRRNPAHWIWSHKRWKYVRPEYKVLDVDLINA